MGKGQRGRRHHPAVGAPPVLGQANSGDSRAPRRSGVRLRLALIHGV
jgi:hypothetical protein